MSDRRYNDDEIAAIFQRATEGPQGTSIQAAGEGGMTLAELQDIGRQVGISPEAVDLAARSLDARPQSGIRKFLGVPIGVGRMIELDRRLTEDEWERLVVELREVFGARGIVSSNGSFRQWTNGNLQALLEPTATGHRLRISTVKGNVRASLTMGAALLGMSAFTAITSGIAGSLGATVGEISIMSLAGIGIVANGLLRVPRWARLRGSQMEAITTRLALATKPDEEKRLPPG